MVQNKTASTASSISDDPFSSPLEFTVGQTSTFRGGQYEEDNADRYDEDSELSYADA